MSNFILPLLLGTLTGLIQLTVVESWPAPFHHLELTALLLVMWIIRFKQAEAIVFALSGAIIYDLLQPQFFGLRLVLIGLAALFTNWLFRRIFTNATLPSLISITLAAFGLFRGVHYLTSNMSASLSGLIAIKVSFWSWLLELVLSIMLQTLVAIGLTLFSAKRKILLDASFGH